MAEEPLRIKSLEKELNALKKELEMTTTMYEARIIEKNEEILKGVKQYEMLTNSLRDCATCSICLEIYTNPHVILCEKECFQNICLKCKDNAATVLIQSGALQIAAGLQCPSCRTRALGFVPVGNRLRELLNFVPRRCEHCNEMMYMSEVGESVVEVLKKHHRVCSDMIVHCPNTSHGCSERMKRSNIESHIHTHCKCVPCKGFVGFLCKSPSSSSSSISENVLITPRTAEIESVSGMGVQKLGCTFIGTYPRVMRHYNSMCSRKENEKIYKDLRMLYDQYRMSRITSILADRKNGETERDVDITCSRLIQYVKAAVELESSEEEASRPGGSLRTAILIEDDDNDEATD